MASDLSRSPIPPLPPSSGESEITDLQLRWREALISWLRWNDAYEHATASMCKTGQSQQDLERLMDQMDQLRRQAVALSRELLD